MPDKNTALVLGALDMFILKTLALEAMHAHGIGLRIEQISHGAFLVNPESLFPALKGLERPGWVESEWRSTQNSRRAKYYVAICRLALTGKKSEYSSGALSVIEILHQLTPRARHCTTC